jgi:mannose-6-phosphate isomerase-like protein (cupin superfamily)
MTKQEERPWGNYQVLFTEPGTQVKRIEIKPGCRLSLQTHSRRAEHWIITAGQAAVTLDKKELTLKRGDMIDVPIGAAHRIGNAGKDTLVFIEVQFGDYLGEDDIVRLADDYGRI